jgi:hypothetical protein
MTDSTDHMADMQAHPICRQVVSIQVLFNPKTAASQRSEESESRHSRVRC